MGIFRKDSLILGPETVYYINMYTGKEEYVSGKVVVNSEIVGQLPVKFVVVITDDAVIEIPDFCVAPASQYLLREVV